MNDISIIELFFERNEQAISEAKNKYQNLSYKIADNILSDKQDIEECVNDAFLCIWNSIPPENPAHFPSYICKITKNISLNKLKYNNAAKRSVNFTSSLDELSLCVPSKLNTEDSFFEKELAGHISRFLRSQKQIPRKIFIRRYYYLDSIDTICKDFNLKPNTAASILCRLRIALKKFLERQGYFHE